MAKISRRTFLKLATATGAGAALANSNILFQNVDPALAESTSPEVVKYTHCVQCNHGPRCGTKLILKDDKIYRIEKRENYNNNDLCAKGLASLQDIYNPKRVLYPMKRTNPKGEPSKWERISWDEAIATIAEKLNGIKEKYGADKVFFLTGDPKEPRSVLQRLAYTFGSPHMGTESSTCYLAAELATKLVYGPEWHTASSLAMGAMPTPGKTKVAIIWGNNASISSTFSFNRIKNARDSSTCKYILVDPRVTSNVHALADLHIQLRPGTDGALALCFGNALIEAGAYDKEFVEKWAHGFEEYKEYVKEFTVEKTAGICEVPAEVIQKAIDILVSEGAPIVCKASAAFPHHTNGVDSYRAVQLLVPLTGSLDVPGGPAIANEPLNIDQWNTTFEFCRSKDLLPKLDHLRADREYYPVWADLDKQGSVQLNVLPEYVKTGKAKAALMFGVNCMMWPQSQEYQKAFQDMEFCAAVDIYDNPWTHDYVDMLLPTAVSWERSCPVTLFGRKMILREPAVKPAGEARPDYRICCDIGTALGYKEEFWGGGEESEKNCIKEFLRTLDVDKPITYEELQAAKDGLVIPMRGEPKNKKWELGLLREDGKPGFTTPTGKVEFASETLKDHGFDALPKYKEPHISPVSQPEVFAKYPLILSTGNRVPMFTHSKQRNIPWLRELMPDPIVRLYKADAEERGIKSGDEVLISTPHGEIKAKAEVTVLLKPGMIDIFHGWAQANVNLLIPRDFDPISAFPAYKSTLCQVTKA
ncbi:MAG: molybdopterin-dependent oxidoreductase [Fretibacterium sp.]|nr:molybdopterin-dependent oxidoreductase [Fretibacterium sp.]